MKYVLIPVAGLMLTACAGMNLPTIPKAPTMVDATDEQAVVDANVVQACAAIDANMANLDGWVALADMLGGAFNIKVGDMVTIPAKLVNAKEAVCE